MFRFLYVILMNTWRGPRVVPMMRRMFKRKDKYTEEQRYAFTKKLIRHLKSSGKVTTEVIGHDKLPKEGGYVMFPNHQGKYDVLGIVYAHRKPCSFVMDKAKSYQFLVREIVDVLDAQRLDLNDVRQNVAVIDYVSKRVAEGKKYIIFSEGPYGINNKNRVRDFKPGSFKCATKAKVPIVPVALIDSYKVFNASGLKPVNTKVIFLDPIFYEEYKDMKTPDICDLVRSRIVECMHEYGVETD